MERVITDEAQQGPRVPSQVPHTQIRPGCSAPGQHRKCFCAKRGGAARRLPEEPDNRQPPRKGRRRVSTRERLHVLLPHPSPIRSPYQPPQRTQFVSFPHHRRCTAPPAIGLPCIALAKVSAWELTLSLSLQAHSGGLISR